MSKKHVFLFAVLFFYPVPTNSYAEQGSVRAYKEGELIVRFAPRGKGFQVTSAERETVLRAIGIGRI